MLGKELAKSISMNKIQIFAEIIKHFYKLFMNTNYFSKVMYVNKINN